MLLDLVRRVDPTIPAVFVDTGLEYPEIRKFVKTVPGVVWIKSPKRFDEVVKEYGYPLIGKDVAHTIEYAQKGSHWARMRLQGLDNDGNPNKYRRTHYGQWKHLEAAPFKISDKCCIWIKEKPLQLYEKETRRKPFIGTLADESIRRKQSWFRTGCNAFNSKNPSSKPLSFWTEQDILQYLQTTQIPYCPIYGDIIQTEKGLQLTGETRTGCMFCMFGAHREKAPNRFQRMKNRYPKQWNYCIYTLGCGKVLDYIGIKYE